MSLFSWLQGSASAGSVASASWLRPTARRGLLVGAGLALAAQLLQPSPPPRTIEGLAGMLGRSANVQVAPTAIAWEPSPGVLTELLWGRRLLFLGRSASGLRDVFRARVRLTVEGRPIVVADWHNLTDTSFGDEQELVIQGRRAAFATAAYGKVQSITLLEIGASDVAAAATEGLLDRVTSAITRLQETGDAAGIRRSDVALDVPPAAVSLRFDGEHLLVTRTDGAQFAVGSGGEIEGDAAATGARVEALPALHKRAILWAVDTVRAEVGPEPIAALEGAVFHARDVVRRATYGWFGAPERGTPATSQMTGRAPSDAEGHAIADRAAIGAPAAATDGERAPSTWPPPPVPITWSDPQRGEGTWEAVDYPWLKRLPRAAADLGEGAPPYFYRTVVRPDPDRPYAKVLAVAMDMRQLELDMEGGVEDPKPLTGAHGTGKIPRDPKVIGRVVGAFNGAFKTTHGEYGMMVHRRVLLPPQPNAATVVVTTDRRAGLGTWGAKAIIPGDLASFRQNLEPLVEDGRLTPSGRKQWGWQLDGTSMMTERSGVCVTAQGHLLYLWGDEVSAATLGKAMLLTGCTYGMHLDMNPHHTGFVFANVRSMPRRDYDAKLLTPEMEIQPERYLDYSPKDFFYLMLRDPTPAGDVGWTEDVGSQPRPSWMAGIWHALAQTAPADEAARAVQVELWAFEAGRVGCRIVPARQEEGRREYKPTGLPTEDAARVLAAVGLGNPRDSRESAVAKAAFAKLPVGALRCRANTIGVEVVGDAGESPAPPTTEEATLPLVLDEGTVGTAAKERRSMRRRGAICVSPSGHTVVATATTDSDEVTALALMRAGCTRALSIDMGAHRPTFLHRAGAGAPASSRYDETVLYLQSEPMAPRAFRWTAP